MKSYAIPTALLILCLQGCGGGGGSAGTAPVVAPSAQPVTQRAKATVRFTIAIPKSSPQSSGRRPNYISPNTQSIVIGELAPNPPYAPVGNPVVFNVTPASPGCTSNSNGITCAITFAVAAGTFDFSVQSFSALNGGGNLLAENTLTLATIVAGVANTLSVTLNGTIASITLPNSVAGTSNAPQIVNFSLQDATGATIVGAGFYDNGPLTVTDLGGFVSLTPASFAGPSSPSSFTMQCTNAGNGTIQFNDSSGIIGSLTYSCTGAPIALSPGSLDFSALAANAADPTYDQIVTVTDSNTNVVSQTPVLNCVPGPGSAGGTIAQAIATGTGLWSIRPLDVGTCSFYVVDQAPDGSTDSSQTITIEIHTTTYTVMSRGQKH
jgi:hypothetical protein